MKTTDPKTAPNLTALADLATGAGVDLAFAREFVQQRRLTIVEHGGAEHVLGDCRELAHHVRAVRTSWADLGTAAAAAGLTVDAARGWFAARSIAVVQLDGRELVPPVYANQLASDAEAERVRLLAELRQCMATVCAAERARRLDARLAELGRPRMADAIREQLLAAN